MDVSPYYAPTFFPASYFYGAQVAESSSSPTGMTLYNPPTYFPRSYFYGTTTTVVTTPTGVMPYNAPAYFPTSYFYGTTTTTVDPVVSAPSGVTPYNAPTFFPPSYFYGATAATNVPVVPTPSGVTPFNAPAYFPTSYFYGLTAMPEEPVVPVAPDSLRSDPYLVILELLRATGSFEDVIFGASTRRGEAGADTYPLVVVTPRGWEESDDFDPTLIVRRMGFLITVVIKSQDNLPGFEQLDRLSTIIKKIVDHSDLGGTCLPALTRIRNGHYEYSNHYPEQSIGLEGEFSMIFDPYANVPATF